jgi:hypothetical protein
VYYPAWVIQSLACNLLKNNGITNTLCRPAVNSR